MYALKVYNTIYKYVIKYHNNNISFYAKKNTFIYVWAKYWMKNKPTKARRE